MDTKRSGALREEEITGTANDGNSDINYLLMELSPS
jgi:hypothetical protein